VAGECPPLTPKIGLLLINVTLSNYSAWQENYPIIGFFSLSGLWPEQLPYVFSTIFFKRLR
jgi:hypothetical protein